MTTPQKEWEESFDCLLQEKRGTLIGERLCEG
jgi:hypothetical protein